MSTAHSLARVRKLLALAESPNPHEAAAAAARAQAIIETHRLQQWLDAEQQTQADPDPIVDARDEPLASGRRIRKWKSALATMLAQVNGCIAYTSVQDQQQSLILVGRQRDRAAVTELWGWLVKRIEWLSATHGAGQPRQWHEAFRIGVVDAVATRLRQTQAEVRTQLEPAALVRVDPAVVAHREALDRFADEHLQLGRGRTLRVDADGWHRGHAASEDLDLPT